MRKHYIDFLRVFTVLLLVPYHTARIYDYYPFYIKADENIFLHLFAYSMHQWRMPILFLVSGVGTYFLLNSRNSEGFVKNRLTRLLVPFLFAVVVIVPPQGYFAVLSKGIGDFHHYLSYYPSFFTFELEKIDGFTGTFTPAHMWFILYLVVFSLLSIPIFRWLHNQKDWFSNRPFTYHIYWFVIPLVAARILLFGMEMNPVFYFILFIYGFILVKEKAFERAIEETRLTSILIGTLTMTLVLFLEFLGYYPGIETPIAYVLFQALFAVNTFMWLTAIVGYAKRYVNFHNEKVQSLNRIVFTIYILHQTLIVAIGYYIQQIKLPIGLEYVLIMLLTFITMYLFIKWVIKPFKPFRTVFGSK